MRLLGGKFAKENEGTGFILITDATVISNITNNDNWNMTGYIGSVAGLVEGNYYWDANWSQFYRYLNSVLTRTSANTLP